MTRVKAAFQKFRDSGNAEFEILRDEEQRHQRQCDRAHGFPAHCGHTGGVALTVAAYQLLCRQVGHHQRAEDDQTAQASAAKKVTVFAGLVRSLGFKPAYECHRYSDKHK